MLRRIRLRAVPALQVLFDRNPVGERSKPERDIACKAALFAFLALHFILGFCFSRIAEMIISGINALC